MIDEFIEFILIPILVVLTHVILLCVNYYMINRESEPIFTIVNCIIWLLITPAIFASLLGIVLSVTPIFTLAVISLALMFIQLMLNIEFLLENRKRRK